MSELLNAKNLRVRFDNLDAVAGASLSLAAGEVVALIGPNGSGKSTLMRALLGLVHGDGQIDWEGRPLTQWDRRALARRVAYLPQSPQHEPGQTVRDVLRMGRSP
ncbi:MAG: ABC transporter ATP-binding protein, partial [Phycisphaerae bacterium]|nr:ABC transporter ATP-binding protein [Phycisphaerae bacterium]